MRQSYITIQTRLACLTKAAIKQDIQTQLAQTIAERKKIFRQLGNLQAKTNVIEMFSSAPKAA